MALKVYRVAVVGCPRAVVSTDGWYEGVGKSCLCNRFVRPEAYTEEHDSLLSEEQWLKSSVHNGDHFIYWGATTKHLHDGSKVRFQIVEQTEFYSKIGDANTETDELTAHPAKEDYISRASALHFRSKSAGKEAYRLKATDIATRRTRGPVRKATQLFPNDDFAEKKNKGIYGYVCVFDPTLEGDQMQRQMGFFTELLPMLAKRKRKIVLVCVKCDIVDEMKIRFGSNISHYALKKTIPFFEVSARENVNVEDAFYALISPPKKNKSTKNGRNATSTVGCHLTYKEVIESRKGDLNRAKNDYRDLLRQKVTNFSTYWSDIRPELEREQAYNQVLALGGEDGQELVKKMFQNQLIELKLAEASKKYGSTLKRISKDDSHEHQVYLSEAFRKHPDLGSDTLYDYVFSPARTKNGTATPTVDDETEILTEPSTPSSYRNTPDMSSLGSIPTLLSPRSRSSTLNDFQVPPSSSTYDVPRSLYDTPRSVMNDPRSLYDIPPSHMTYDTPRMMYDVPRALMADTLSPASQVSSRESRHFGFTSPVPNGNPPPLPPRENMPPRDPRGTYRKSFDNTAYNSEKKANGELAGETRRLSSSMDCLLFPDDGGASRSGNSFNKLDAEPYLRPMEVKKAMAELPPLPPLSADFLNERNAKTFASMRVSGKSGSRPPLPNYNTFDSSDSSTLRSLSLERRRGHKRSQSNPFILEPPMDRGPPMLPPRKCEPAPPVPPRSATQMMNSKSPTPVDPDVKSPIESSLEFGHLKPSQRKSGHVEFMTRMRDTLLIDDNDDNISTVSGPFEEIETQDMELRLSDRPGSPSDRSTSASIPQDLASLAVPQDISEEDDQYAHIEDFQQYMQMAPAPISGDMRAGTVPLPSMYGDETDADHHRRKSKTISQVFTKGGSDSNTSTPKKESQSSNSGILSWPRKKWRKQQTVSEIRQAAESPSPPPPKRSTISTSQIALPKTVSPRHNARPLPPSPTKAYQLPSTTRKSSLTSQGSNIYEVIDENFKERVKRPSRQSSNKSLGDKMKVEWAPPVDQSLLSKYLEVVQKFFERPEIQQQWIETVKEVMPNEDPEAIQPPFYKNTLLSVATTVTVEEVVEAENEEEEEDHEHEDSHEDDEEEETHFSPTVIKPQPTTETLNEEHRIPITLHGSDSISSLPASPATNVPLPQSSFTAAQTTPQSPFTATHTTPQSPFTATHTTPQSPFTSPQSPFTTPQSPFRTHSPRHGSPFVNSPLERKRVPSRDDLIEQLNRELNDGADSSDSDDDDTDSSISDSDSDIDSEKLNTHLPKVDTISSVDSDALSNTLKTKPTLIHQQTDLDMALELRDSVSVESDMTDSAIARSPQSNSAEELDVIRSNSHTGEGIEVTHCVKPSQLLRGTAARRREVDGGEGSRNLSDSGISNCHSQTFEDGFSVQNIESDV